MFILFNIYISLLIVFNFFFLISEVLIAKGKVFSSNSFVSYHWDSLWKADSADTVQESKVFGVPC